MNRTFHFCHLSSLNSTHWSFNDSVLTEHIQLLESDVCVCTKEEAKEWWVMLSSYCGYLTKQEVDAKRGGSLCVPDPTQSSDRPHTLTACTLDIRPTCELRQHVASGKFILWGPSHAVFEVKVKVLKLWQFHAFRKCRLAPSYHQNCWLCVIM